MLEKFTKIDNLHIAASICLGLRDLSSSIYIKYSSLKHMFSNSTVHLPRRGVAVGLYRAMVQRREALETSSDAWQQLALPARDICSVQRLR